MRKEHWYVDYATFDLDKDINGYKQTRENIEEFMKKNPEMAFTIGAEYANPSLFYKGFGSIEGHYVKHTQAGYENLRKMLNCSRGYITTYGLHAESFAVQKMIKDLELDISDKNKKIGGI